MNEIAEKLSNKRNEMGISLKEVSEDIKYDISKLEAIESGNFKSFKDIFVLKCIIKDYAKYLGLDYENIIDDFNDFVFESTSKIPLDDIKKANKTKDKTGDDMIASPYTIVEKKKNYLLIVLITLTVLLVIVAICMFFYNESLKKEESGLKVSMGDIYER